MRTIATVLCLGMAALFQSAFVGAQEPSDPVEAVQPFQPVIPGTGFGGLKDLDEEITRGMVGPAPPPSEGVSQGKTASSGRSGRRFAWFLALAGGVAALVYGITILLATGKGTFRIESEVAGVQVEVVDEQHNAKEITINHGDNETLLTAGKYRVRIARPHENISLDKDTITLSRGEEVVARIARLRKDAIATSQVWLQLGRRISNSFRPTRSSLASAA